MVATDERPKMVESMLALRDKGYAWPYIAKRFGLTEREARRMCQSWLRARMEGDENG